MRNHWKRNYTACRGVCEFLFPTTFRTCAPKSVGRSLQRGSRGSSPRRGAKTSIFRSSRNFSLDPSGSHLLAHFIFSTKTKEKPFTSLSEQQWRMNWDWFSLEIQASSFELYHVMQHQRGRRHAVGVCPIHCHSMDRNSGHRPCPTGGQRCRDCFLTKARHRYW